MAKKHRLSPQRPAPARTNATTADLLARWFDGAARQLPWRTLKRGSRNAYHALVSESMLQQTQVSRVLERFPPFIKRFPTAESLAGATEHEVLAAWQGLGYYRRARFLHAAAKVVVRDHEGRVPEVVAELRALPGVGRYTAGAIASIVFGQHEAIVDGNVARVFQRLAARKGSASDAAVMRFAWLEAAKFAASARDPGKSNEALMEFGGTICTPAAPRCHACPLKTRCAAHARGVVEEIPAPRKRAPRKELVFITARIVRSDGALLLEQRDGASGESSSKLWAGLWQSPTMECADGETLSASAAAALLRLGLSIRRDDAVIPFLTTHRAVRFVVFDATVRGKGSALAVRGRRWVTNAELPQYALSNAAKKVVERRI